MSTFPEQQWSNGLILNWSIEDLTKASLGMLISIAACVPHPSNTDSSIINTWVNAATVLLARIEQSTREELKTIETILFRLARTPHILFVRAIAKRREALHISTELGRITEQRVRAAIATSS